MKTTHPDPGELRAFLDGEVPDSRVDEVEAHLEKCAECRATADAMLDAEAAVAEGLSLLDVPPDTQAALRRVRRQTTSSGVGVGWGALARAALLILGLAAGIAAAVPGSPVRGWIGSAWTAVVGDAPARDDAARDDAAPPPPAATGVRVAPEDGAVRIELLDVEPGSPVRIRVLDRETAGVTAPAGSRFRTGPGRMEVRAEPGALSIEVPGGASRADVSVNGRPYLRIRAGRIELPGPTPEPGNDGYRFRVPDGS